MKNNQNISNKPGSKKFNYELKLFRNLSHGLCSSLENLVDIFEELSLPQKSMALREIENTKQNIDAVNNYLIFRNRSQTKKKI